MDDDSTERSYTLGNPEASSGAPPPGVTQFRFGAQS